MLINGLLTCCVTGVGKSRTVQEAARRCGKRLVRFNLSQNVTIPDLLGLPTLDGPPGQPLVHRKQPFTVAYEEGHWLLLDEINLARGEVLVALENAITSDSFPLIDQTSTTQHMQLIRRHPDFRLFATQNPSGGFFRVGSVEVGLVAPFPRCTSLSL